jgi:hypothetical protein
MKKILVNVRLPDGSTMFLPVIENLVTEAIVAEFDTDKDAFMWVAQELPEQIRIVDAHRTQFVVYDGNKKAQYPEKKFHESWKNMASHTTLSEAIKYAKKYLGHYSGVIKDDWKGEKIGYKGFGDNVDTIEIREENY